MSLTFTENGIMIDGKPLTEHPKLRFGNLKPRESEMNYFKKVLTHNSRQVAKTFGVIKPNEDKPMEYRVTTDELPVPKGTKIRPQKDCCSGIHYDTYECEWYANDSFLESNTCWFEPVEQVQEGQYWRGGRGGCTYTVRVDDVVGDKVRLQEIKYDNPTPEFYREAYLTKYYWKLSTDEIKEALTEEAKRRGLKESSRVCTPENGHEYSLSNGSYDYKYYPNTDELYCHGILIYITGQWAEVLDQTPDIEVNGYTAEFHEDYVKFGCAKIAKEIFIDTSHLLHTELNVPFTSKTINKIQIGEGAFTNEQIHEIAEYYQTNKDDE